MAPDRTIVLGTLPSGLSMAFKDSSFFSRNNGQNSFPTLPEVLARSAEQNTSQFHNKSKPTPAFFESLGLVVKFGRDQSVHISKGQCLWALRQLLPEVPVPGIFSWSTEDGYVLLYPEMVKGVTVEKHWPSMTEEEKIGFWGALKSAVI